MPWENCEMKSCEAMVVGEKVGAVLLSVTVTKS